MLRVGAQPAVKVINTCFFKLKSKKKLRSHKKNDKGYSLWVLDAGLQFYRKFPLDYILITTSVEIFHLTDEVNLSYAFILIKKLARKKFNLYGIFLWYLLDLQPLTVGACTMSSLALKLSSWLEELTTVNPIFLGIPLLETDKANKKMKCYYIYIYVLHLGVPTLPFARETGIGSKLSKVSCKQHGHALWVAQKTTSCCLE